jgi:REP element-mobilizing transposase RayT
MALEPFRGHSALRRGRWSQSRSEYFLTLCTEGKRTGLTVQAVAQGILHEAQAMTGDGTWNLRSLVVMPDHVHLLVVLGTRLPLSKTIQRLKAKTSASLRSATIAWERGFFDRQPRPDDDRLPFFSTFT